MMDTVTRIGAFRPFPPDERSIMAMVRRDWEELRPFIEKNLDVGHQANIIGKKLDDVARDFAVKKPDDEFEWDKDLFMARNLHQLNLESWESSRRKFGVEVEYWKDAARKQYDVAQKLMLSGINYVIIGHGTVAITCVNALVAKAKNIRPG